MPIENPTHHTCPDCGFMWEHGEHGGHDCAVYLKAKIERLEAALAERRSPPAQGEK